jgi:hypothetical protein
MAAKKKAPAKKAQTRRENASETGRRAKAKSHIREQQEGGYMQEWRDGKHELIEWVSHSQGPISPVQRKAKGIIQSNPDTYMPWGSYRPYRER